MKKIQHKVYILEKEDGTNVSMNDFTSLNIAVNDNVTELTIEDLFKKFEGYEDNKLVGWSILEFFKFEDGYLLDEDRNKISFYSKQLETHLYVKKVRNAIVMLGDIEIKDAYIRDVKKLISLSKGKVTSGRQVQIDELKDEILQNAAEEVAAEEQAEPVAEVTEEAPAAEAPVAAEEKQEQPAEKPVIETPAVESAPQAPVAEKAPKKKEVAASEAPAVESTEKPAEEPAEDPAPVEEPAPAEELVEVEPEPDKESYEYLKRYYVAMGYKEYAEGDFRLLYKTEDFPYLIKLTGEPTEADAYEQIAGGDLLTDDDEKIVYEAEINGKSDKITFAKAIQQVAEQ